MAARVAGRYSKRTKRHGGTACDTVVHCHLGSGAILHALHPDAGFSVRGIKSGWGTKATYLYGKNETEARHQVYATA